MAAVADWHGRVTELDLSLRGRIDRACRLLERLLDSFDRKRASRPPYRPPAWARPLLEKGGEKAMAACLERRRTKRAFAELVRVYRSLDMEVALIHFGNNYIAACEQRVPARGREHPGYAREHAFLEEMTWCRNDRVKFRAILAFARFAPVERISFFAARARERRKECRNPNLILCRAMQGIGIMARRFPGPEFHDKLLSTLPALEKTLRTEGRNNSASKLSSDAIAAIAEITGSTAALGAYLANLEPPEPDSEWLRRYTERYFKRCLPWLRERTGQDFGADSAAWRKWFAANRRKLHYHRGSRKFLVR